MEAEGQGFTNGHATWTSAMSSFMLSYLTNVVSSGERTSSGFKKVHYNSCAKAINEKFQTTLNGEQIKNHLKTWSRRFAKINRIRKVSGTGWDEDSFTITLDEEHYNGYVKGGTDVPDDLFDSLINLPGFEQNHISLYFNYLVAHPHIARAFNKLPFDHKLI
ncbi:10A19I.15 [Zea mays]|uniref:10A19I.15 n=1 Tax=Zea mays TaxID=4577 RepID=A0A1D6HKF2_MAIZE|nr:10A19I.15 [Zea mays]